MSTKDARGSILTDELPRVSWHISSRSTSGGGNCVEAGPVRDGSGRVALRHSRHRNGATFVYARDEWDAFIAAAKAGAFDF